MSITEILKFLGFLLFFLYIPAKIILRFLKVKIEDRLIEVSLTIVLGIVLITLFSFIIRSFGLSLSFLWLIFGGSAVYLSFNLTPNNLRIKLSGGYILLFLTLLVGVVTQNLVLFRGGWKVPDGLIFPSLHDTMWNIALAGELSHHFPAENPAISGILLKNNHYFYPFFLTGARFLTGIDIFDLYFRLGPILVSILFGLGIYSVSSIFTKNIITRILTVFLGYFSGNFAYLVPLILGGNFDWKGNTFFADQPFDQIINPYSVFGFVLMLFGIYVLSGVAKKDKKSAIGFSIIGGFLFGGVYGFKSFGGVIMIATLWATTLLAFIFYRKLTFLSLTLIGTILFGFIFFLTTDFKSASLMWAPGWLLTQMMTDKDKLNLPQFADLESYYSAIGNYLGLFKTKFVEFIIYLIGNLGTRIIGLAYLLYIFFARRPPKQKYIIQFIGIIVFISLSIPLLFNLRNSTFNIIQFTPYALVLLAILTSLFLEKIYYFADHKRKRALGIIFIVIFVFSSIPVNVKNILSKFESPKDLITSEEMSALNYLRTSTQKTDILLIDPHQFSYDPIYIPAISERRVYLSSPNYAIQTGLNPESRVKEINEFFESGDRQFLEKNKIAYIYLLKTNQSSGQLVVLSKLDGKAVFENSKVLIQKTAK